MHLAGFEPTTAYNQIGEQGLLPLRATIVVQAVAVSFET